MTQGAESNPDRRAQRCRYPMTWPAVVRPVAYKLQLTFCRGSGSRVERQFLGHPRRTDFAECKRNPLAAIVATMPGAGASGSLALASRLGHRRFPTPGSLANYWGLTPACRNSGEATDRLGSITKLGSSVARFQLSQMVMHVLRRDRWMKNWYRRIKSRRGAKMCAWRHGRLATILWQMVRDRQPYVVGGLGPAT